MFERAQDWPEFAALVANLKAYSAEIEAEARALMDEAGNLKPWHEPEIYEGHWDVYGLFWAGREVERHSAAPLTKELLGSWQPSVFNAGFSVLRPGVEIKPHIGYTSDVLRLHFGVIIPETDPSLVGIMVGGVVSGWSQGHELLFDDTQEHNAWNRSGQSRVVLLVDVLRPAGREKRRRA